MGTTPVLHYMFIQTQCVGEWKKKRCLPFGVPVVWRVPRNHSSDCYFCMVPPIQNGMSVKKKSTLVYPNIPSANGLCLMVMDFLFLNLRTILLYTLTMMTVFLQTAKNNSHQLQEIQTTYKAQTPPIIRAQKASSVTSSGISNFQKIRQNFWHQIYNSGIYYTTPWCRKFEWFFLEI